MESSLPRVPLAVFLLLAIPFADALAQSDSESPRAAAARTFVRAGDVIQGEIADADPVIRTDALRDQHPHSVTRGRSHVLDVEESGRITVELRSHLFDAYLVVRDAASEIVAEDNNGLYTSHSRITIDVEDAGRLEIVACALADGRGSYELTVRSGDVPTLSAAALREAVADDWRRCVAARELRYGKDHVDTIDAVEHLAECLYEAGNYEEARTLFRSALEVRERVLGSEHPDTGSALGNLGALEVGLGNYDAALPLLERAVAVHEESRGPEHLDTARSIANLVELHRARGDLRRARSLADRALAIRTAALGPDHPDVASALDKLASVLQDSGEVARATTLAERALAIRRASLGNDHSLTATSLNNVASLKEQAGDIAGARAHYEAALEIHEKVHGTDHVATGISYGNVAKTLEQQGDYAKARALYERSLSIIEKALGPDHPHVATSVAHVAGMSAREGDLEAARSLYERALRIEEAVYGPNHPTIASTANNFAVALHSLGELEDARRLYERAAGILETHFGPENPQTAILVMNIGGILMTQGDHDAALARMQRARTILVATLGAEHPYAVASVNSLGEVHFVLEEFEAARPLFEQAFEIRERLLGGEHPDTLVSLHNLAATMLELGDATSARPIIERVMRTQERLFGDHPETAKAVGNLASLHFDERNFEEARRLHQRVFDMRERLLGAEHPHTTGSLARLLLIAGILGEAEACFEMGLRLFDQTAEWVLGEMALAPGARRFERAAQLRDRIDILAGGFAMVDETDARVASLYERTTAWKGLVFRHSSRLARVSASEPSGEAMALRARLRDLDADLAGLAYTRDIADVAAHREGFEAARVERSRTERDLLHTLGIAAKGERVTARELASLLPEGSALVDFMIVEPYRFLHDDDVAGAGPRPRPKVYGFIVRAGADPAVRLVDLGDEQSLRAIVEKYLEWLAPDLRGVGIGAIGEDPSAALRDALWRPLAGQLDGVRQLFVIPDGFLAELPFGAVRVTKDRYLIEYVDVVYAEDPVTLRNRLRESSPERSPRPSLLLLGGVDYDRAAPSTSTPDLAATPRDALPAQRPLATGSAGSPSSGVDENREQGSASLRAFATRFAPLPNTDDEIHTVAALHAKAFGESVKVTRLTGSEASEERLTDAMPGREVVHLASHGFFERDGLEALWQAALQREDDVAPRGIGASLPDETVVEPIDGVPPELVAGLALSGVNVADGPDGSEGVLTAWEVGGIDLRKCELAVLSACETALGALRPGEGLLSLRRAFREAGALTVVASHWKVDDEATRELLTRFYERLWLDGASPSAALRSARLALLRDSRFDAPAYWAAFTLSGEWR